MRLDVKRDLGDFFGVVLLLLGRRRMGVDEGEGEREEEESNISISGSEELSGSSTTSKMMGNVFGDGFERLPVLKLLLLRLLIE